LNFVIEQGHNTGSQSGKIYLMSEINSLSSLAPIFVHLRCHSEYSIVDGIVRIDDYVKHAANDRMPALALTDLNNLFGAIKFYKAARGKGIKPIIGCDIWLENPVNREQPSRALLLCQSHAGYLLLCQLLSRAYLSNQYRGRAEFKREWFVESGTAGLLMLSGAMAGDVGQACVQGNLESAIKLAADWKALFPERFYLEVQRIAVDAQKNSRRAVHSTYTCDCCTA
jgi:DNA polymerase-3 subunit alpha